MFGRLKDPEPFFCNICGGPATSQRLIKASISGEINPHHHNSDEDEHLDSDDSSDEETDVVQEFYKDYCDCTRMAILDATNIQSDVTLGKVTMLL